MMKIVSLTASFCVANAISIQAEDFKSPVSPTANVLDRDDCKKLATLREQGAKRATEFTSCHPECKKIYDENTAMCHMVGTICYFCNCEFVNDAMCWFCCCGTGWTGNSNPQGNWQKASKCQSDGAFEMYGCQTVCCRFCCEVIPPFGACCGAIEEAIMKTCCCCSMTSDAYKSEKGV